MMKIKLVIIINLIFQMASSQNLLNTSDYGTWEYIYNGEISNDGQWYFYHSEYKTALDTLTIKEISGDKEYKIPNGKEGLFSDNSRFFTAFIGNYQLQIIDLLKDSKTILDNIQNRSFSTDDRFLILTQRGKEAPNLLIKHLGLGTEISIPQVIEFQINPIKNEIALVMKNRGEFSVNILNLNTYSLNSIRENKGCQYINLVWSEDGSHLVVLESKISDSSNAQKILHFSGFKNKKIKLDSFTALQNQLIEDNSLDISPNGDLVYFKCTPPTNSSESIIPNGVQVWKTSDKLIYPMRKINNLLEPPPISWVWNSSTNRNSQITDTIQTQVIKINNDYILKYDELAYEPQYKYVVDVDLYLHNLNTDESKLLLEKQKPNEVFIDPSGNNIVFFKKNDWWVYNVTSQKSINLSKSIGLSFLDIDNDRVDKKIPFSKRIKWVEGENSILVCDEFDVWKLSLDGNRKEKLTNGREIQRKYRLFIDFRNSKNIKQNIVNLQRGFLLQATDENRNSGYFLWQPQKELKELTFGPFLADQIKWNENLDYFTFRIQAYDLPPKIIFYNRPNNTLQTLFESNANQIIKDWGKAELLSFTMKNGESSKVCLIYPVNYDPTKTYPMIVSIYEKQTERMHEFFPISWLSGSGFNPTHYALDGYFVLMPDISYEIGNVGVSANEYVNESVDFAIWKENIDREKIGIIGHSFGGYETAFIITQTDRFAAAVAGAAVTDMVTFYHTINWNTGQEEMFRFEDYQMRMGSSYFKIKNKYLNNSPFHNIENVSTPLLLWSGENDLHINFNESIRFYLALRRLKKNAKLLLLENEAHVIVNMDKKNYLSKSIKDWFDKYCK